jgi:aspartyl-tRNA(Asn)/glutamyl-tRNA(Gln) amidotransferase subunit C
MSDITIQDINKLAKMMRLQIDAQATEVMQQKLASVIGWVAMLDEVATDDVAIMSSPVAHPLPMRDDIASDQQCDVLSNAPKSEYDFYVVPKVVG